MTGKFSIEKILYYKFFNYFTYIYLGFFVINYFGVKKIYKFFNYKIVFIFL